MNGILSVVLLAVANVFMTQTWNHCPGFALMVAAVFVVFKKW